MVNFEFDAELAMPALAKVSLQDRLSYATSADTVRGLFFNGVLDMVRDFADEEAERRCRLVLSQSRFFDFFSYSILDFLHLTFRAAQYLSIQPKNFDVSLRRLGARGMKDFLASMAGKTFLSFSGADGRRLLTNLPVLFRTAVSYGERSVRWLGPRSCQLFMQRDFLPPAYHEGAIRAALESIHPRAVSVRSTQLGPLDSQYVISWE